MSRRIDCLTPKTDRPIESGLQAPRPRSAATLIPPIEVDEAPAAPAQRVSPEPFYRTDRYRLVTPYSLDPARIDS